MKRIEFIADDFGRSDRVNTAIVRSHREGRLTGASLMMGQGSTDEAVALACQNPRLEIGWHVHLCDSIPLLAPTWAWGNGPASAGLRMSLTRAARQRVRAELESQWEAFVRTGLRCAFLNSHHHLHLHPFVLTEIRRIVGTEFPGWIRGFNYRLWSAGSPIGQITRLAGFVLGPVLREKWGGPMSDTVWGVDRFGAMSAADIEAVRDALPEGRHEFIFHPGALEPDLDERSLLELSRSR